jgi:hypothetical protein
LEAQGLETRQDPLVVLEIQSHQHHRHMTMLLSMAMAGSCTEIGQNQLPLKKIANKGTLIYLGDHVACFTLSN